MGKMNPVVHFEMPADNKDRMVDFYENVFGWNMKRLGPEMGNYVLVQTADTDPNGMIKNPGSINGGFFDRTKDNQNLSIVIAVDDIKSAMKNVTDAGGKILGGMNGPDQPDDIPGVGLFASFIDTEGNRLGILQPNPRM